MVVSNLDEIISEKYICPWGNCVFTCSCSDEITRHIYYHAFHKVLTTIGKVETAKDNIPQCWFELQPILPELTDDFKCLWENCDSPFKSIAAFNEHVASHADSEHKLGSDTPRTRATMICRWNTCGKVYRSASMYKDHVKTHIKVKTIGCHNCGALFRTKSVLYDHCRRQEANNTQEFQCAQCFKMFATEYILRKHLLNHVNSFKCTLCDMTANTAAQLATHVRYRHLKERPFHCSKCSYRCIKKSDLRRHDMQIHERKVYQCIEDGCTYSVRTLQCYRRHYTEVHEENPLLYSCHCCPRIFRSSKNLTKHLKSEHNFKLPSGHARFTYKMNEHGFHCLETTRIESLDVSERIMMEETPASGSDHQYVMYEVFDYQDDSSIDTGGAVEIDSSNVFQIKIDVGNVGEIE